MRQRELLADRPRALCIQELRHGGYIVTAFPHYQHETELLAAFTRLSDAVGWMEEAMRAPSPERAPAQSADADKVLG